MPFILLCTILCSLFYSVTTIKQLHPWQLSSPSSRLYKSTNPDTCLWRPQHQLELNLQFHSLVPNTHGLIYHTAISCPPYVCIRDLVEKSRSLVHSVFENKQSCFVEICIGALANRCGTTNRTSKYNQHLIGSADRLDVSDRRFACRNLVLPFWKRRCFVRRVRVFSPVYRYLR